MHSVDGSIFALLNTFAHRSAVGWPLGPHWHPSSGLLAMWAYTRLWASAAAWYMVAFTGGVVAGVPAGIIMGCFWALEVWQRDSLQLHVERMLKKDELH